MERLCFEITLHPGAEAEYDRRHDELWPQMREALLESGWSNYSLFRRGSTVIGYAECTPDAETAIAAIGKTHVNAKWRESLTHVIASLEDEGGNPVRYRQVWNLEES